MSTRSIAITFRPLTQWPAGRLPRVWALAGFPPLDRVRRCVGEG